MPDSPQQNLIEQAKHLFQDMDWHGAVQAAERVLATQPDHAEARQLRDMAKQKVDELDAQLQQKKRVADARRDIQRLIDAGELQGAAEHLRRANEALGSESAFDELDQALRQARSEADLARQNEWAQRRSKEAQALIDESARLATRGDFEGMLEKLRQAKRTDPEHDRIDELLATAERQAKEYAEQEVQDRQIRIVESDIRRMLDSLYLDQAETRLHAARKRFGDDPRLGLLQRRLEDLRSSARTEVALPTPENLNKLSQLEPVIRQRQRSLADAYSWNASFLYPLRRPVLFLTLAAVLFAVELLVHNFRLHPIVGLLGPLFGLVLLPAITRTTLEGVNDPPSPYSLTKHLRLGVDALIIFGTVLVFGLPLLLFVLARPWHSFLDAGSSPVGWMMLAVLLWITCALLVPAWGVAAAFGPSYATRIDRLLACLNASGRSILTVDAIFVYFVFGLVLRAFVHDLAPAIGLPLLALFEAYGLVLLPHLLGVTVRNRRLEWAKLHTG